MKAKSVLWEKSRFPWRCTVAQITTRLNSREWEFRTHFPCNPASANHNHLLRVFSQSDATCLILHVCNSPSPQRDSVDDCSYKFTTRLHCLLSVISKIQTCVHQNKQIKRLLQLRRIKKSVHPREIHKFDIGNV